MVNLVESDSTEKSSDKSYGPSSRMQSHFERYSSTGLELIDRIPVFQVVPIMAEELVKKKRVRAGHRASVSRMVKKAEFKNCWLQSTLTLQSCHN